MVFLLILTAIGVIVGLPIALYGFMRLDEQPGIVSWTVFAFGLLVAFGPVTAAAVVHYQESGTGRYSGR